MSDGLPYNGWPSFIRHGRDSRYYQARTLGVLPPATQCLGCSECFKGGATPYHAEEYGPTLEAYWASCVPLCHCCHAIHHARFATPNRWRRYLAQASVGAIDRTEFPRSKQIVALLSKFKNREDVAQCDMPAHVQEYFRHLPMTEYDGPPKVATLLIDDLLSRQPVEVPDWTLYGSSLELLGHQERQHLASRGLDVAGFLSGAIPVPMNSTGRRIYRRLYARRI